MSSEIPDGVRAGHVRAVGWTRVTRGRHRPVASDDHQELLAWQSALPSGAVFTGLTAVAIRDWWLPELPVGTPVFAAIRMGEGRVRRRGLRVARLSESPPHTLERGLRVATAGETVLACARLLGAIDLLIVLDGALHGGADREEIMRVARRRTPGAPALRRALALSTGRAESAWESVLTLFCRTIRVDVEAQHEVWNGGAFVARGDLRLVGARTLLEYDGAVHRDRGQHHRDLRRERALLSAGWRRMGVSKEDLVRRAPALARDVLAEVGSRVDHGALYDWHDLLADSCVTASGRARLLERVHPRRSATNGQ